MNELSPEDETHSVLQRSHDVTLTGGTQHCYHENMASILASREFAFWIRKDVRVKWLLSKAGWEGRRAL